MEQMQVIKMLRKRIEGSTQRKVAADLGISAAYLSDILAGKRAPGPTVLNALGLQQKTVYSKNA